VVGQSTLDAEMIEVGVDQLEIAGRPSHVAF
jgi:hypothetical protein